MSKQTMISVVMTIYTYSEFLRESISSILNQTYVDYEFIIVVEHGADEKAVNILKDYAQSDNRIRLIFNESRLGLAASLNSGINVAKGKYIARMDDDDISMCDRFEKQVHFLENNEAVGVCGTLQKTITPESEKILQVASDCKRLKVEMLFGCQLSHTSVMFRRILFKENNWVYSEKSMAEDYDLWMQIIDKTEFHNLNEALVIHRYGFGNISEKKGKILVDENVKIIRNSLERYFHIDTSEYSDEHFYTWRNYKKMDEIKNRYLFLDEGVRLLCSLEKQNQITKFAQSEELFAVLLERFCWYLRVLNRYRTANLVEDAIVEDCKGIRGNIFTRLKQIYPIRKTVSEILYIKKNTTIVIYGNGNNLQQFIENYGIDTIRNQYDVIGIYDEKQNENQYFRTLNEKELTFLMFDYLIISTSKYYWEVRDKLLANNIPPDKICFIEQLIG